MRDCARRAWWVALLLALPIAGAADPRPNLLLLMAEDLGPRLGVYGDAAAHTPHLDALAAEGVRYTRAFTSAGVCAPSRAAILMGAHQNRFGAGHMRAAAGGYVAVPPPDWKGFPELLRAAGYWTVNNGKTDYQMSTTFGGVFGGPASIWDEERGDDWRGRAPGQPFFAYLTFQGTHESQVWPTWRVTSLVQLLFAPMRIANHLGWVVETDPATVPVPPYYPDTPTVRADLARHYNNVATMDAAVAEVLAKLDEDGLTESTVVVFMGDHGDGLPRAKRWLYDSGLHVPLFVRWPGRVPAGTVNDELVSGVDLAPSFLALAGVPVPAHVDGRVLLGPEAGPEPPFVYAARDRIDESPDTVRAVRDRRFKYVRNLRPEQPYVLDVGFRDQMPMMQELLALDAAGALEGAPALWFRKTRDREELYDTARDPHELENLAADPTHAPRLAAMRAALDDWLATSGDLGLLPEEELAEYFWPGGAQPRTADPTLAARDGALVAASATPGASLEVRVDGGPWRLVNGPIAAPPGATVTVRAQRYGFAPSGEVTAPAP